MKSNTLARSIIRSRGFTAAKKSAGFTLLEMLIVLLIISFIVVILVVGLSGSSAGARATMLDKAAKNAATNINMIAMQCGSSTTIASNPILATGKTMADVLYEGAPAVKADKQPCYMQSSVRSMRDGVSKNGTQWEVKGFPIAITGGGTNKISVAFSNVPDEVVLLAAQNYNSALTALAASDTTGDVVRYGASTSGTRTLTFLLD